MAPVSAGSCLPLCPYDTVVLLRASFFCLWLTDKFVFIYTQYNARSLFSFVPFACSEIEPLTNISSSKVPQRS